MRTSNAVEILMILNMNIRIANLTGGRGHPCSARRPEQPVFVNTLRNFMFAP